MQSLIHIDISQAGQKRLVEKEGLESSLPLSQLPFHPCPIDLVSIRIRSEGWESLLQTFRKDQAAEFAHIGKHQMLAVVQGKSRAHIEVLWKRREIEPPAHSQVPNKVAPAIEI